MNTGTKNLKMKDWNSGFELLRSSLKIADEEENPQLLHDQLTKIIEIGLPLDTTPLTHCCQYLQEMDEDATEKDWINLRIQLSIFEMDMESGKIQWQNSGDKPQRKSAFRELEMQKWNQALNIFRENINAALASKDTNLLQDSILSIMSMFLPLDAQELYEVYISFRGMDYCTEQKQAEIWHEAKKRLALFETEIKERRAQCV